MHTALPPGKIGRNVQAYVNDVVVNSKKKEDLLADLEETFSNLRHFNMKLNLEKCVFVVPLGKLLIFPISEWGIKANPEKINAIVKMGLPKNSKTFRDSSGAWQPLAISSPNSAKRLCPCLHY